MLSNLLIYASGGSGKSTSAAQAAEWMYKNHGKKTRVVNADGGGTRSAFAALLDLGLAEVWDLDTWDDGSLFQILDLATKGWWPQDVNMPNSPLLPPYREWRPCPVCKKDSGATGFGMVSKCATCNKQFGAGILLPVERVMINGADEVGLMVCEGLTAFGESMMRRLTAVNPEGGATIKDGNFTIATAGKQHYGQAQRYLGQFVANTRRAPFEMVLWTALELRGHEDGQEGGRPIYGPSLPGKKLTTQCIPWFTDVIHLDVLPVMDGAKPKLDNGVVQTARTYFLSKHFPPDNPAYAFDAKKSVTLDGAMPDVMPAHMGKYLDTLVAARQKAAAVLKARLNK